MAHNDLEREAIEDFYEEYRLKYAQMLEGWQEVVDMYSEQELQKKLEMNNNIKNSCIGKKRSEKDKLCQKIQVVKKSCL